MLVRKAIFLASVSSGIFGATQADAACFGQRNCCKATPVVCPPCQVSPMPIIRTGMHVYGTPVPVNGWIPSTCGQVPTTIVSETVVSPSPFANRPSMRITENVTVQKRLSDGSIVQETRLQSREMSQSEEIGFLIEELQKLDRDVFGNKIDRPQALESRVNELEKK